MKKNYIIAISMIMIIFYFGMSVTVLLGQSLEVWGSGILFLIESIIFFITVAKRKPLRNNLICIFAILYFFLYMTMAQLYLIYSVKLGLKDYLSIELILFISYLLIYLGIVIGGKIKCKTFSFLRVENKVHVYYILLVVTLGIITLQVREAGGFFVYLTSSYQGKYVSVSTEKMLGGLVKISTPFTYYNLMYISDKRHPITAWVSKIFFMFNLIMIYARGHSLAMLYQFIAIVLVQIYGDYSNNMLYKLNHKQKKWVFRGVVLVFTGIVAAILIRFNRSSDHFSLDVLNNAYMLLLSTSTFDALKYLHLTITNLTPRYTLGQFIFPFIFMIPRRILVSKPVELGRIVATTFQNFSENINGGFAATPMGEFYYDFGFLGIILGMFFIGVILSVSQKMLSNNVIKHNGKQYTFNDRYALIVSIMVMFSSSSISTSWTTLGTDLVGVGIFIIFAHVLNKTKISNIKHGR